MKNKNRVEWVDIYKGFLIFLVVVGHAFDGMVSTHTFNISVCYKDILYMIYSFHMPAFLTLSNSLCK